MSPVASMPTIQGELLTIRTEARLQRCPACAQTANPSTRQHLPVAAVELRQHNQRSAGGDVVSSQAALGWRR